ncbi:MAG: 3-keto-disaccharide hydrolase, partial [Marinilabilia sp.]
MRKQIFIQMMLGVVLFSGCQSDKSVGEWKELFDGSTLDGWKASTENPESFSVENGAIKCSGDRAHLFYEEDDYKNFEWEAEVKTDSQSNSGIFIHTQYQESGWPSNGYEIQVNNTYRGSEDHPERRKTGSIYNIRNVYYPVVEDDEWFKLRVKVVENYIEVFINDQKINEYIEPADCWRWDGGE